MISAICHRLLSGRFLLFRIVPFGTTAALFTTLGLLPLRTAAQEALSALPPSLPAQDKMSHAIPSYRQAQVSTNGSEREVFHDRPSY